ncbi:MAG: hypothetical protein AUI13_07460 [Gemmatimonadetes bacterium 13_2_20CM_2_69_23]|nr:MAG: hypothetical protein AUI13_07460 [Gemmatimonadetes bacterium 13_2_20CM_2_69_23]
MKALHFRLTPLEASALQQMAAENETTVSQLVRRVIRRTLSDLGREVGDGSRARARDGAGTGVSS